MMRKHTIWTTDKEWKQWKRDAKRNGMKISAFIRNVMTASDVLPGVR